MNQVISAAAIAAISLLGIVGCGGGGGGGDSDGTSTGYDNTSLYVATRSVDVSAAYGDPAPERTVRLTASNVSSPILFLGVTSDGDAVSSVEIRPAGAGNVYDLVLRFRQPTDLPAGTLRNTLTINVCYDQGCGVQVQGSPVSVSVSYTIADRSRVALETPAVSATTDFLGGIDPQAVATISVSNPPGYALTYVLAGEPRYVSSVANLSGNSDRVSLQLNFRSPSIGDVGVHSEAVNVRVCYDAGCAREVPGSPLVIDATYTVTLRVIAETGLDPLPYVSRTTLSHDVIDAEYVRALNAIVMVSATPTNTLYLYDVTQGTERQLALNRAPTAVSVSPDGRFAAVGHDNVITHVDLQSLVNGTPVTRLLNVSTNVLDLVLDGRGYVHALPAGYQWDHVHSVAVATNAETLGPDSMSAGSLGRLHPSGDYMYTANNGISPSDIDKFDLRGGTATHLYDSPYHGDYRMCGDLWFKQDGTTIYTKCGNSFRSSTTQSHDMTYSGRLLLSDPASLGFTIRSLSQSDQARQITLIEEDGSGCNTVSSTAACYSHLALYQSESLDRVSVYSLPPIEVGLYSYYQRGLFVFHSSDGQHRYLISRLHNGPDAATSYFLTVVD